MENKNSLVVFAILTTLNIGPCYALNFISGTTPISSDHKSYFWVQNILDCQITTKAWISDYDYQKINNDFHVEISEHIKKDGKSLVKIVNNRPEKKVDAWLNILQQGDCDSTRLTRLNFST